MSHGVVHPPAGGGSLFLFARVVAIALIFPYLVAFSWGEPEDPCRRASGLVAEYEAATDPSVRNEIEQRIVKLCPDGAPAQYILGRSYERGGDLDRSVASYREALRIDPSFSRAHGSLGLLLLSRGETDEAAVELSRGLQGGDDPRYHRGLAAVFSARKLHALALYHCDEALRSFPGDPLLLRQRAQALAGLGRKGEAAAEYRRLLDASPNDTDLVIEFADLLDGWGDTEKAIELLKGVAASSPSNREIHRRLSLLYVKKGDEASAEYEAVLAGLPPKKKPNPVEESIREGERLAEAGEYEKALAIYRGVLREKPEVHDVRRRVATILVRTGKDDEAITELREIVRLRGENGQTYTELARLYARKGMYDEAIVSFKNALKFPDVLPTIRVELADLYDSRGSYPQAILHLQEFLKTHPEEMPVQIKLARLFLKNRQTAEAVESYRKVIAQSPDTLEAHQELAALYWKLKKSDEAEQEYREVLRLKKDDQEARKVLTSIYAKKRDYERLVQLLSESVELDPRDAGNHYKLGLVYEFSRQYDKALESYGRAVELKDDYAKAYSAMGRVAMKLGKLSEAKGYLEKARAIDPELEETTVLLSNIRDEFSETKGSKGKKGKKKQKKGTKKPGAKSGSKKKVSPSSGKTSAARKKE